MVALGHLSHAELILLCWRNIFEVRLKKKTFVFPLTDLKNLGSVGRDFLLFSFIYFFSSNLPQGSISYLLCIFALTWHIFKKTNKQTNTQNKTKQNKTKLAKNRVGQVSGNTQFFLLGLTTVIDDEKNRTLMSLEMFDLQWDLIC